MRKILITIFVLMTAIGFAQVKIDKVPPLAFGRYTAMTNSVASYFGLDTVAINGLTARIVYAINSSGQDTSYSIDGKRVMQYGKKTGVMNRSRMIFGTDTVSGSGLTADFVYLLNPFSTSSPNTWTGTQTFSTLIADLIITNRVDSINSTYWYDTNGVRWGWIDPANDTVAYLPSLIVGSLGTNTIINGTSIYTQSVDTDTLKSHSPQFLWSDSIFFGKTNDTAKYWYNQITTNGKTRGVIYPNIDYGLNLGRWDRRIDTLNINRIAFRVGTYSSYIGLESMVGASDLVIRNYFNGNGGNIFLQPYAGKSVYSSGNIMPQLDILTNLASTTTRFKNTYTRTLNADSVRTGHSIFMSTVTEPASPTTGQIYFDGTNWKGWNGTAWKQFDN